MICTTITVTAKICIVPPTATVLDDSASQAEKAKPTIIMITVCQLYYRQMEGKQTTLVKHSITQ